MSLCFNMPSRFVTAFLPRSKYLLIWWLQTTSGVILEPKKIKSAIVSIFSYIYLPWSDVNGCHDLSFLMLSFNPAFSLFSFTFIKRLFSFSSLSAIRVVSSVHLRLLVFLQVILILSCASYSLEFCMSYSAYKLNKQGENKLLCCTPFSNLNQSVVLCLVLTVASWPAYRFLQRQVRWSGIPISFRIFLFLLIHSQVI